MLKENTLGRVCSSSSSSPSAPSAPSKDIETEPRAHSSYTTEL